MIPADRLDYPPLIIVTGPPRSGTTMMQIELASSSSTDREVEAIPECTYTTLLIEQYTRIKLGGEKRRLLSYFGSKERLRRTFAEIVRVSLRKCIAEHRDRYGDRVPLVLKDPLLSAHLPHLPDLFPPQTRYVTVIRNPFDIFASLKVARRKEGTAFSIAETARWLWPLYIGIYRATTATEKLENLLLIRYEDFVSNDGQTQKRLEDFVGFRIRRAGGTHFSLDGSSDPLKTAVLGKAVTASRMNRYLKILSFREKSLVYHLFKEHLATYYGDLPVSRAVRLYGDLLRSPVLRPLRRATAG